MSFKFDTSISDIVKGFLAVSLVVLVFVYVPKFINKLDNINKPIDATVIEQIATNVVKVQIAENDKVLKRLLKELKPDSLAIQEALENNETIKELGTFMANFNSHTNPDPNITKTPSGDPNGERDLEEFMIERTDSEGNKFPTGIVRYSPNVTEGPKFSYQQFPLDFKAVIVGSEKDDVDTRYVELWAENNFVKSSKGKKYPIKIDKNNVKWAKAALKDKGFMWNTRIGFTGVLDSSDYYPAIGVSLFSYGRTQRDMDWRFLDFSVGGNNNNIYGVFSPLEYNIGNSLPLVENVFMGPTIGYGSNSIISYGIGISVPF